MSFYVVIKKQFVEVLELKEGSKFQGKYSKGSSLFLLGILNANKKIRKRTDTDVAFTPEYSRVSIFHRQRECTN